jgi:hypothetical protein
MSSFYEDASLVVIPSGYKTSKIYAEKPTDGSGDLTFTRASGATRVASNGLIEKVRTNLILQSQAFNTTWAAVSASVSANTTANPLDGAINADTITLTGATTQKFVAQAVAQNGIYTHSVYAKAGTHNFIQLMLGNDAAVYSNFNISTGSVTASSGCVASIVSVGSGWYRCSMAYSTTTADNVFILAIDSGTDGRFSASSSTGTFILFGAQLETGDIATAYIPTTTAAVSVGPVSNVPRLDYLGSSCPRLNLEPQRTNIAQRSEDYSNSYWSKFNTTITVNATTSPDGYVNADKFVENTANNFHSMDSTFASGTGVFTASIYAKQSERRYLRLNITEITPAVDHSALFDLQTGTVLNFTTGVTASIQSAANGFYRVIITSPALVGGQVRMATLMQTTTSASPQTYLGDGTSGMFLWGAQLEAGAYATSYIPTLAASVTRVADAASKTGISSLIGQTEGTLFVDAVLTGKDSANGSILLATDKVSSGAIIRIIYTNANALRFDIFDGTSFVCQISAGAYNAGSRLKIAGAYKANDFVLYVNGVQIGTDTGGAVPTTDVVNINTSIYGDFNGSLINQALLFKTRLTNAQLAELTTL